MSNVTVHIVVSDAAEAARWYAKAFGSMEISRIPLVGGKVMAVEIAIGDSHVHVGSEFREFGILSPLSVGGTATVLQINVLDVEALWQRALAAGASVRHELQDAFWGERHGQITDPFGHRWNLAQRVREVSHEEIVAAAARMFAAPSKS